MKSILSLALLISLAFVSCKKDKDPEEVLGCTDTQATNYNASATTNDGSCTYNYQSTVSFWQDFASSQAIASANSTSFCQIYIDGILKGTFANSSYNSVEPPCGNGIYSFEHELGASTTGSIQYDLRYYQSSTASWIVFQSGNISLTAEQCTSVQVNF